MSVSLSGVVVLIVQAAAYHGVVPVRGRYANPSALPETVVASGEIQECHHLLAALFPVLSSTVFPALIVLHCFPHLRAWSVTVHRQIFCLNNAPDNLQFPGWMDGSKFGFPCCPEEFGHGLCHTPYPAAKVTEWQSKVISLCLQLLSHGRANQGLRFSPLHQSEARPAGSFGLGLHHRWWSAR